MPNAISVRLIFTPTDLERNVLVSPTGASPASKWGGRHGHDVLTHKEPPQDLRVPI